MKGTRVTATMKMKRVNMNKRRRRETAPGYDIMFASTMMEVGVSEVKAAGYDKLLASRVEGRVLSRRVEGVMNLLQVYHTSPRDDGVDREVRIPKLVLRACERGKIGPVDKKICPKKSRTGYALTKDKIKDDNNNDDKNNDSMDDVDMESKAPCSKAWDLMWDNGKTGVWYPDYREQYNLKDAEWRFDAIPKSWTE